MLDHSTKFAGRGGYFVQKKDKDVLVSVAGAPLVVASVTDATDTMEVALTAEARSGDETAPVGESPEAVAQADVAKRIAQKIKDPLRMGAGML